MLTRRSCARRVENSLSFHFRVFGKQVTFQLDGGGLSELNSEGGGGVGAIEAATQMKGFLILTAALLLSM